MAKGISNTFDLAGRAIKEAANNYIENNPGTFPHTASAVNYIMRAKNYEVEREKHCCYYHGCQHKLKIVLPDDDISICMDRNNVDSCSKRRTKPGLITKLFM